LPPTLSINGSITAPMQNSLSSGASFCFDRDCNGFVPDDPTTEISWTVTVTQGRICNPLHRELIVTLGTDDVPADAMPYQAYYGYKAGHSMIFSWTVRNWDSTELALIQSTTRPKITPYLPPKFGVTLPPWVSKQIEMSYAPVPASDDMCPIDKRPFSVNVPKICSCEAKISSGSPGENVNVTITFKTNVDFPNGIDIHYDTNLTVSGLVKAASALQFEQSFETAQLNNVFDDVEYQDWDRVDMPNTLIVRPRLGAAAIQTYADTLAAVNFNLQMKNPVPLNADWESGPIEVHVPSMPNSNYNSQKIKCGTVKVERKAFTFAKAGQVTPYPCSDNAISVTLSTNYVSADGMYLLIEGLPMSVFPQGDETAITLSEVAAAYRTGENNTDLLRNPRDRLSPAVGTPAGLVVRSNVAPEMAQIWFYVPATTGGAGDMLPDKRYIFSFPVKNPGSPLANLPQMKVTAYPVASGDFKKYKSEMGTPMINELAFEYDEGTEALCDSPSVTCESEVYKAQPGEARPLFIRAPKIIHSFIGQSKPYPESNNIITVSLQFNVHLYPPTRIELFNFEGLKEPSDTSKDGSVVHMDAGSTGFCPDILDADDSSRIVKNLVDPTDPAISALSMSFVMKEGTNLSTSREESTKLEIRVGINNPNPMDTSNAKLYAGAQFSTPARVKATLPGCSDSSRCCVTMAASDVATLAYPSSLKHLQDLFGNPDEDLQNGVRSAFIVESRPLYLRKPTWRVKQISQEVPYPLASNTIYMTLGVNVPLTKGTLVHITGFESKNPDIVFRGTSVNTGSTFPLFCGSTSDCTSSVSFADNTNQDVQYFSGSCVDEADNVGTGCRRAQMKMSVAKDTSPNLDYYLGFYLDNPRVPQEGATISIRAMAKVRTDWEIMTTPDASCVTCGTDADQKALFIRDIAFGVNAVSRSFVRQTNPFSRGSNNLVLSFVTDGRMKPETLITISGFREWDKGQVHLMEVEKSEGFAKDFGIKSAGNLCTGDACTNLRTELVSNDNAIVYAKIADCPSGDRPGEGLCSKENKMAGVGCTLASTLEDPGNLPTRKGSGLKIDVKVDCGNVLWIKIQSPGSGYTEINQNPAVANKGPFDGLDLWRTRLQCTTAPEVSWFRSHELLEKSNDYPKYNDATQEIILKIATGRATFECVEMQFTFPIHNPIVAVDTNPAPVFPLNLTLSAKHISTENGATVELVVAPFYLPVMPATTTNFSVCNDGKPIGTSDSCELASIARQNGDAVPMRIYAPDFLTADIGQSMPYPGPSTRFL